MSTLPSLAHCLAYHVSRVLRKETGATAVEYGLLIALIAAVIIAAVITLGGGLNGIFTDFNSDLGSATS